MTQSFEDALEAKVAGILDKDDRVAMRVGARWAREWTIAEGNSYIQNLTAQKDAALFQRNCFEKDLKSLQSENEKLRAAMEFAIEKHDEHSKAYPLDIFPDDGRKPCETTSGRMGRHMVKCYEQYLQPLRERLGKK